MKTKKYSSIKNLNEELIKKIENHGFEKGEWSLSEKIHGANCSFLDGDNIQGMKREGELILPDEIFCNYQKVFNEEERKLKELFKILKMDFKSEKSQVFGELFGGAFIKHPNVERIKGAIKIQKGVIYSPDNHFSGFDILVNEMYLPTSVMNKLFDKVDIFYSKPLFKGSFYECIKYPNEFNSTISERLGYPRVENNICEGIIIRPEETKFMGMSRLIIKNKNDKFSEKSNAKAIKIEVEIPSHVKKYIEILNTYVCENRLDNVLSKIGAVSMKDLGTIIQKLNKDALDDFIEDNPDFNKLEREEQKMITKALSRMSPPLVKEKLSK